jgi:hypothetical protein
MQCQAILKSGRQCSRKSEPNSNYCWQHQNSMNKSEDMKELDINYIVENYVISDLLHYNIVNLILENYKKSMLISIIFKVSKVFFLLEIFIFMV